MRQLTTKLIVPIIILIAIIDGFLIANRYLGGEVEPQENGLTDGQVDTQVDAPIIEDVFEEPKAPEDSSILLNEVPFTTQAMQGWSSPWDKYGEEACVYMAMRWISGREAGTAAERTDELLAIGQWEVNLFGTSGDTTALQTAQIFTDYYNYSNIYVTSQLGVEDLIDLLHSGNIVLLTINGQLIGSPYYSDPAPKHHAILLVGYDEDESTFIANDPGTSHGKQVNYSYEKTVEAIQDSVIVIRP